MKYLTSVLKRFEALPKEIQDAVGGLEALKVLESLEGRYRVRLGFLVILVTIGELMPEDMDIYLIKKYKLDVSTAEDIAQVIKDEIFAPIIEDALENSILSFPLRSIEERKQALEGMFSKDLTWLFVEGGDLIDWFNDILRQVISDDLDEKQKENFEKKLSNALLDNQEKITTKAILVESKRQPGTVGNWIKDFIGKKGSGYFSGITLSEYLVNSENTRSLNKSEKNLLKNILILYRNLRYFEQSLEESKGELEIIPRADDQLSSKRSTREVDEMTKIELKAYMEENNLTEEDIKKIQSKS